MQEQEVKNTLMEILMIPLSEVVIHPRHVSLYLNSQHIGNVLYTPLPQGTIYDTDESVLTFLRWDFIVRTYKTELTNSVSIIAGNQYKHITPENFGEIIVRKDVHDTAPKKLKCYYQNGFWMVKMMY